MRQRVVGAIKREERGRIRKRVVGYVVIEGE